MPVMDGLHATRLIRSYEQRGYWDASVAGNRADHAMTYSDQQRVSDERQCRKRIPIVAVSFTDELLSVYTYHPSLMQLIYMIAESLQQIFSLVFVSLGILKLRKK